MGLFIACGKMMSRVGLNEVTPDRSVTPLKLHMSSGTMVMSSRTPISTRL